jgi:hypothetical protein
MVLAVAVCTAQHMVLAVAALGPWPFTSGRKTSETIKYKDGSADGLDALETRKTF